MSGLFGRRSLQRAHAGEDGSGRYETFVLRLWMHESHPEHGEIHHVQSNSSLRFHEMGQALDFVRKMVDGAETHAAGASSD
jgi:hypothetical protein